MKIPHSNLFQEEYLFLEGSNYLLINKYWGSKYFPVNNYWGVLFFRGVLINGYTGMQFASELNNAHEKIVHWKKTLFMLPSGAAGNNYIDEVTRLMKMRINDTSLRKIPLQGVC